MDTDQDFRFGYLLVSVVVVVVLVLVVLAGSSGRVRYTVHALQPCQHPTLLAEGRPAGEVSKMVNVTQEYCGALSTLVCLWV